MIVQERKSMEQKRQDRKLVWNKDMTYFRNSKTKKKKTKLFFFDVNNPKTTTVYEILSIPKQTNNSRGVS